MKLISLDQNNNLGIHLPIIFDYDQHSSEVMFEEGRIRYAFSISYNFIIFISLFFRISTNFCFGEKCKAPIPISEQKDNNADYYDSVG